MLTRSPPGYCRIFIPKKVELDVAHTIIIKYWIYLTLLPSMWVFCARLSCRYVSGERGERIGHSLNDNRGLCRIIHWADSSSTWLVKIQSAVVRAPNNHEHAFPIHSACWMKLPLLKPSVLISRAWCSVLSPDGVDFTLSVRTPRGWSVECAALVELQKYCATLLNKWLNVSQTDNSVTMQ